MEVDLFQETSTMIARPAWQVIDAARRQFLTGVLTLDTLPPTHVYLRDGQVYFAERTTDGSLPVRLLVEGVITREQMQRGTLIVSGVEHLGRMFERDETIDRDPVELCVELMTDDVLTSVAEETVNEYRMVMYKRHPSGIDRWMRNKVEVVTHLVEGKHLLPPDHPAAAPVATTPAVVPAPSDPDPEPEPAVIEPAVNEVVVEPVVAVPVVDEPAVDEHVDEPITEPVATVEPEPVVEPEPELEVEHVLVAVPPAAAVPVFQEDATPNDATPNDATPKDATPKDAPANDATPKDAAPVAADEPDEVQIAHSAMEAIMSTNIADEVADAVRRALEAIDSAAVPPASFTPDDFVNVAHLLNDPHEFA